MIVMYRTPPSPLLATISHLNIFHPKDRMTFHALEALDASLDQRKIANCSDGSTSYACGRHFCGVSRFSRGSITKHKIVLCVNFFPSKSSVTLPRRIFVFATKFYGSFVLRFNRAVSFRAGLVTVRAIGACSVPSSVAKQRLRES